MPARRPLRAYATADEGPRRRAREPDTTLSSTAELANLVWRPACGKRKLRVADTRRVIWKWSPVMKSAQRFRTVRRGSRLTISTSASVRVPFAFPRQMHEFSGCLVRAARPVDRALPSSFASHCFRCDARYADSPRTASILNSSNTSLIVRCTIESMTMERPTDLSTTVRAAYDEGSELADRVAWGSLAPSSPLPSRCSSAPIP
jgi:hypothetical protein